MDGGTDGGHEDLLVLGHIGGTADDLLQGARPDVHLADAQAVRVRMLRAFRHMTHNDPGQHAFHRLEDLHAFGLQASASEYFSGLLGA